MFGFRRTAPLAHASCVTSDEGGQGLVEYSLIVALIAILLVGALTGVKDGLVALFNQIPGAL
jgi:pilus assembly protein Flp/PilA